MRICGWVWSEIDRLDREILRQQMGWAQELTTDGTRKAEGNDPRPRDRQDPGAGGSREGQTTR